MFDDNDQLNDKASNIVSIENFEEINDNFALKAPKKGKLFRGPNWNAYNRENLGSIPRNIENILIREHDSNKKIGFSSQSDRFSSRSQSVKYAFPGPGAYNKVKKWIKNDPSMSSKGFGNGFISQTERFDDFKEYNEKYLPGPGQYKQDESTSLSRDISTSISYKSLYNTKSIKSLKIHKELPGPGYYNPIMLNNDRDETQSNFFFKSKKTRFSDNHIENIPGPGRYFKNQSSAVKDNTVSYFFKKPRVKEMSIEEKYLNDKKTLKEMIKKKASPGPGDYELIKELGVNENNPVFQIHKQKQVVNSKNKIQEKVNSEKKDFYEMISQFDIPKKDVSSANFVSKSPKLDYFNSKSKKIPGPAYYRPNLEPTKATHNFHLEKEIWI